MNRSLTSASLRRCTREFNCQPWQQCAPPPGECTQVTPPLTLSRLGSNRAALSMTRVLRCSVFEGYRILC